ncbi:MAG: pyruvate, water dikinase [Candidatus Doudnabacteria bacterium Gr01-1014_77]|uniref:Pyruvate, water dikinase n=1 Tax=Candidatus Doudnabacteria bacterium Gr01-1014_77 TaxID=2017133 RepID=A0A554JC07_9BACT|nr:MAG: pyruvate, water dikinase [Candidatus Doudnabacteria bacterium Gr01-1014_77]
MNLPYKQKWIVLEREDYANYIFVTSAWQGFTVMPKAWGFENSRFLSAEYINTACNLFIPYYEYKRLSQSYFSELFIKPKAWHQIHKDTEKYAKLLIKTSAKLKKVNVVKLSNKELLEWREKIDVYNCEVHDRRGFMFFIETVENLLTNYLHQYLQERIDDLHIKKYSSAKAFQILTTPTKKSIINQERDALIKIALIKNEVRRTTALKRHAKKYEWLEYGLQGRVLDYNYFVNELKQVRRIRPSKLLQKRNSEYKALPKKQQEVLKLLNIHPQHIEIFKIAQDAIYCKGYGKDAQFYSFYCLEGLLREIGRRANLSLEQVKFLSIDDCRKALLKSKNLSTLSNERMKYSLHFSDRGQTIFFHGPKAKELRKKLKFVDLSKRHTDEEQLSGQPAFAGFAKGRVKIINTPQEMVKMHEGDVLVSHMTNPDIVPVMKKAIAIVTDLGGITCHAAIVSRELKKPCIIGTKVATKIFKDGDLVEVDANKGIVRKLK